MSLNPASSTPMAETEAPDAMLVWFRFLRLGRRVTSGVAAELRALGLSIPQFDVLSTLTEREGLTQQELAARLYVTKGNVSGLIDRLVDAGLVERRPIPEDRRSHALHLTQQGRGLAHLGIDAQRTYVEKTLGRLSTSTITDLNRLILLWRDTARNCDAVVTDKRE